MRSERQQQLTWSREEQQQHPQQHQCRRRPRTQQRHPRRRPHLPSTATIAAVAIAAAFIWPRSYHSGVDGFVMSLRPASRVRESPKSFDAVVSGRTRHTSRGGSMVAAVDKAVAAAAVTDGVGSSLGDRLRADFPILDQVGYTWMRGGEGILYLWVGCI